MFIPEESFLLKEREQPHIRLGIMGYPGSGKTWSAALTFPNPVICDFDNNLERVRKEARQRDLPIHVVPFWDGQFRKQFAANNKPAKGGPKAKLPQNTRDVFAYWLAKNYREFTPEQTLIVDSWTMLQNSFDVQQHKEPEYTQDGKINSFAFWGAKIRYAQEIHVYLDAMACNVVVLYHIQHKLDNKTGRELKLKTPLMQGSFVAQIAAHHSNFFEQVVTSTDPFKAEWITRSKESPVKTDIVNCPSTIPATYESFTTLFPPAVKGAGAKTKQETKQNK